MLQSLDIIKGMPIAATDGVIGAVDDLYFDDDAWTIRYLAADSGTWLPGRRVLLAVEAPDGDAHPRSGTDVLFDAEDWQVRYLAIDTDAPISGRTVLLALVRVDRIDGAERRVNCALTRDQIRESPDYDEVAGPNGGYEGRLYSRPIGMP